MYRRTRHDGRRVGDADADAEEEGVEEHEDRQRLGEAVVVWRVVVTVRDACSVQSLSS